MSWGLLSVNEMVTAADLFRTKRSVSFASNGKQAQLRYGAAAKLKYGTAARGL